MSGGGNLLILERDYFKYLFLISYFDLKDNEYVFLEFMVFICNYLNCMFDLLDDVVFMNYFNYL